MNENFVNFAARSFNLCTDISIGTASHDELKHCHRNSEIESFDN